MGSEIDVRHDDGVLVVSINRPAKKNALTAAMYADLAQAVASGQADPRVKVLLLRGEGGNFTSGNDIGLFLNQATPEPMASPATPFIQAIVALDKPLVACVQGHAVGIGATVLLHCDCVVASDDARIRFPFVDLGLCPEFASTLVLQQRVGLAKASEWLLLGAPIPASEAHLAGLVNRVVPHDVVEDEARSIARTLASKPQQALRATRALIRHGAVAEQLQRIAHEGEVFASLRHSPEAQAIFRNFLARSARAPGQP